MPLDGRNVIVLGSRSLDWKSVRPESSSAEGEWGELDFRKLGTPLVRPLTKPLTALNNPKKMKWLCANIHSPLESYSK
jgi:hypothetical protein